MTFSAFNGLGGCKQCSEAGTPPLLGLTAPVGTGARCRNVPSDVQKVQRALNRFSEIEGGPVPKLLESGSVDSSTSAAITRFQTKQFGARDSDGIIDPGKQTEKRLAGPAGTYSSLPAEMLAHISNALSVVEIALGAIMAGRYAYRNNALAMGYSKNCWDKLVTHFQIDKFPDVEFQLMWLDKIFRSMKTAIGHQPQGLILFQDEPSTAAEGAFAYCFSGGYHLQRSAAYSNHLGVAYSSIYLCPKMQKLDQDAFTYVMIHELAHFVGPNDDNPNRIVDYGYKHRPGYDRLYPWHRTHNADSIAQFAFDAAGRPFDLPKHFK